ncbi:MAG: anthranilate phosphoribosyltransferase [Acidobacteria bacterium RIFCSPLOWO2_12_FULL_59_11]|nr:MAG: anthranilate phosphoribosyltransferase [Acidobacteria bacterium RIFCSPLOWO2_12_FULL_59_11]
MGQTQAEPQQLMRSYLRRIATGPELSKPISRDEACMAMQLILEQKVDPVQAGVFLIALRMKRETEEENRGVLDAIREATRFAVASVKDLVDLADPYDGFSRHLPASPFLPALLAVCGLPAVSHGCERLGPKFGVTHRQVLAAAGGAVDLSPEQAAARIADPQVGWAYVDQRHFCPALHHLVELRTLIVKRPCLSTLEKMAGPVRASGRIHLVVGFVHKGYEQLLPLMARHAGYATALGVRGVEGGVVPPLRGPVTGVGYRNEGPEETLRLDPAEAGVVTTLRAPALPEETTGGGEESEEEFPAVDTEKIAGAAAEAGLEALGGRSGPTRDSLLYAAAAILWYLGRSDSLPSAADFARKALDSGHALSHFRA